MRGFSSLVLRDLRRLEEVAPGEGEQLNDPTASIARQDLVRAVVASLLSGGTMMGNSFYFGFGISMSRKAGC